MRAGALLRSETCVFGADVRRLPLAGIAPERAHGPERAGGVDPGGLWLFLHLGLDVWVDLRGRGCQFSARHGSLSLLGAVSSRARPICFLLLASENGRNSASDDAGKAHPPPP